MAPSATTPLSAVPLTTNELTKSAVMHVQEAPVLAELDASKLVYTYNTNPKTVPSWDDPVISEMNTTTDHMVTVKWTVKTGWQTPQLKPYGPMLLEPTASVLHYATEAFEGMKVYRGVDGKIRIFRPNLNAARFLMSSIRIALPTFPPDELQVLIKALLAVDCDKWLPDPNTFLYIRPTIIASGAALGVQKPKEATIFIIAARFPNLSGSGGLKLLASKDDMIRAWPGGFGYAKVGANYGPSLLAQGEAKERGFDQILWLFGPDGMVTEAGASNFFVVWKNATTGQLELVTAPLGDKIILDGVTRRSVLELARARLSIESTEDDQLARGLEKVKVVERKFTIKDILDADHEGRLIEAFACGTAFFIAPVATISYKDTEIVISTSTINEDKQASGHYASVIKTYLKSIMYGRASHPWGVVVEEKKWQDQVFQ